MQEFNGGDDTSSVTSIGACAFQACYGLKSAMIPTGVESIGNSVFNNCENLTNIVLPSSITNLGKYAFQGCSSLHNVMLPSGITDIKDYTFSECTGLVSVTMPIDLKNIGSHAFDTCKNLTVAAIPEGVTNIGSWAFASCSGLTMVTIPSSMTSINNSFVWCNGLTSVTIPASVRSIANYAFTGCGKLKRVVFGGNAPSREIYSISGEPNGCVAVIYTGTTGWDGDGDGEWYGLELVYRQRDSSPIPNIGSNAHEALVQTAIEGSADVKLMNNITDGTTYGQYREWANKVKAKGESSAAGAEAVKNAPNAWLSFALGSETLIETIPTDGDLKVDKFEPATESDKFDFTVSVKDIEVGSNAAADNLKKVFGLEGGTTLEPGGFSSDNVNIIFGTPENGKVKFTAGPKNTSEGTFFMKVKMTP